MQHLNDDMDELFRKAADDYPLYTGNPDWDRVAAGLTQKTAVPVSGKNKYRRYTWLLLLIPIGVVSIQLINPDYFGRFVGSDKTLTVANKDQSPINKVPAKASTGSDTESALTTDKYNVTTHNDEQVSNEHKKSSATSSGDAVKPSTGDVILSADAVKRSTDAVSSSADAVKQTTDAVSSSANAVKQNTDAVSSPADRVKSSVNHINPALRSNSPTSKNLSTGRLDDVLRKTRGPANHFGNDSKRSVVDANRSKNLVHAEGKDKTISEFAGPEFSDLTDQIDPYVKSLSLTAIDLPDANKIQIPAITKIQAAPTGRKNTINKKFYVGVIGGIDVTTVSLQKTAKTGNHFGIMAGYSFNRKWGVEAGLISERKYYYTKGDHFDKSGTAISNNWTIISADGSCRMLEIPLSVKYNLTNTFKSNIFITGGLTSYIMKREDYTMLIGYGPSAGQATHDYAYKNSSKNFFSELRLTGGYALKLPRNLSLRLEPYLNIPVSGVGIGKLRLVSGGTNLGILKSIF